MTNKLLTLGQVASRYGLPTWKIQKLADQGRLPGLCKAGVYRVVNEKDLKLIEDHLRDAGLLAK